MRYSQVGWVSCLLLISAGCGGSSPADPGAQAAPDPYAPVRQSLTRVAEALEAVKGEPSVAQAEKLIPAEHKALQAMAPVPAPPPPEDFSSQALRWREAERRFLNAQLRCLEAENSLLKRAKAGELPGPVAGEKELNRSLDNIHAQMRSYLKEVDRVAGRPKADPG